MLNLTLMLALLGLGGVFCLLAMLDSGLSFAGRVGLLGLATLAWVLAYPLMMN
jgi:hypothetical protein